MTNRIFPAKIEALSDVLGFVERMLEEYECPMKIQMALCVVIEEVFVNVAHYAYGEAEGELTLDIGFDEEIYGHQLRYETVIIRGKDLWWHDLNYIAGLCEKSGARPWIWSDYYWHHKDLFIENMSRDILQSNWFYKPIREYNEADYARDFELRAVAAYSELDALGFDQVPTSSTWEYAWNTYQTVALGKDKLSPDRLKGFMTAPWFKTIEMHEHRLLDDAFKLYHARCAHYPETL